MADPSTPPDRPGRFACPTCGGNTHVLETRTNESGLRRRRRCLDRSCGAKLTTQEMAIPRGQAPRAIGAYVILPRAEWERLRGLAMAIIESARIIVESDPRDDARTSSPVAPARSDVPPCEVPRWVTGGACVSDVSEAAAAAGIDVGPADPGEA